MKQRKNPIKKGGTWRNMEAMEELGGMWRNNRGTWRNVEEQWRDKEWGRGGMRRRDMEEQGGTRRNNATTSCKTNSDIQTPDLLLGHNSNPTLRLIPESTNCSSLFLLIPPCPCVGTGLSIPNSPSSFLLIRISY